MQYDIVIAGDGLVGLSLAAALKNTQYKIALLTQNHKAHTSPSYGLERTTALSLTSRYILENIGAWIEAYPLHHVQISMQGQWGVSHLHAKDFQLPALGYIAENKALLDKLNHIIDKEVYLEEKIENIFYDQNHIILETQNKTIESKLLIGADGSYSKIRNLAGIEAIEKEYKNQVAFTSHIDVSHGKPYTAFERFTRFGPLAFLPVNQKRYSIVWTLPELQAKKYQEAEEKEVLQALQKTFGYQLGEFSNFGQRIVYPLSQVLAKKIISKNIILVGNAAQSMHPVAGQGFNLALRDIACLVYLLKQYEQDIASNTFLKNYKNLRSKDRERVALFTDSLARIFTLPLGPFPGLALALLNKMPLAKRAFVAHGIGSHSIDSSCIHF